MWKTNINKLETTTTWSCGYYPQLPVVALHLIKQLKKTIKTKVGSKTTKCVSQTRRCLQMSDSLPLSCMCSPCEQNIRDSGQCAHSR